MSVFSAACMGLSILLFLIFAGTAASKTRPQQMLILHVPGIEDHPLKGYGGKWPLAGATVITTAFPAKGVTWVDCTNAVLNISFLWVPQILFPTFISEVRAAELGLAVDAYSLEQDGATAGLPQGTCRSCWPVVRPVHHGAGCWLPVSSFPCRRPSFP